MSIKFFTRAYERNTAIALNESIYIAETLKLNRTSNYTIPNNDPKKSTYLNIILQNLNKQIS